MTQKQIDAEFAKTFDCREQADARAQELGPEWKSCRHYRQKNKWQLARFVGWAL